MQSEGVSSMTVTSYNSVIVLRLCERQDDGIDPDDPSSSLDDSQGGGNPFSSQTSGYPSLDEWQEV